MQTNKIQRAIGAGAFGAILIHLIATVLQNTPDSYNQDLRKFTGGWSIPGWRFFAPNPGIQNVHLLIRELDDATSKPSSWRDITPNANHGWLQIIWNPSSRGPKALFDAMQQLTVMNLNHAEISWVKQSVPYSLISTTAISHSQKESTTVQFMMMNYFPSAHTDQKMQPVLISDWIQKPERTAHQEVNF